jgi:hypothetical protein
MLFLNNHFSDYNCKVIFNIVFFECVQVLLQSQLMHPILRLTYFGGLSDLRFAIVNVYFFDVLVVLKM